MSYTRSKHVEIPFVAHDVVTYPPSEHGGTKTVSISGTVPVDINVFVDTDRYDHNIDRASYALVGVTGAVTATEAAQVHAIRETGRRVSESAVRGFFGLVGNELSSKISEGASTLKSNMALLLNESESLENVHRQMERDYQTIKARYAHTFSLLDDELRRRIHEVNKQAFALSTEGRQKLLSEPYLKEACGSYSLMSATYVGEIRLACATAKRKAFDTLQGLGQMSGAAVAYQDAVHDVLVPAAPAAQRYVPVLYASVDKDESSVPEWQFYQAGNGGNANMCGSVADYLVHAPENAWQPLDGQEKARIDNCFMAMMDQVAKDGTEDSAANNGQEGVADNRMRQQRVHDEMLRLYHQSAPLTCTTTK